MVIEPCPLELEPTRVGSDVSTAQPMMEFLFVVAAQAGQTLFRPLTVSALVPQDLHADDSSEASEYLETINESTNSSLINLSACRLEMN